MAQPKKKGRVPQKVKNIAVLVERLRDEQVEAGKTFKNGEPLTCVRIGRVAKVVESRNGGDTDAAFALIKEAIERGVVYGKLSSNGNPYKFLHCLKDRQKPAGDKRDESAAKDAEAFASDLNF